MRGGLTLRTESLRSSSSPSRQGPSRRGRGQDSATQPANSAQARASRRGHSRVAEKRILRFAWPAAACRRSKPGDDAIDAPSERVCWGARRAEGASRAPSAPRPPRPPSEPGEGILPTPPGGPLDSSKDGVAIMTMLDRPPTRPHSTVGRYEPTGTEGQRAGMGTWAW